VCVCVCVFVCVCVSLSVYTQVSRTHTDKLGVFERVAQILTSKCQNELFGTRLFTTCLLAIELV
jgi:hypothetical protein